jgi:hypothetical protein
MWNEDFAAVQMPTIYDEWMHVLGHSPEELHVARPSARCHKENFDAANYS